MKYIIFTGPGGIASVLIPAYADAVTGQKIGETEDDYLARVIARCVQAGSLPAVGYKIVDPAAIPVRDYRNAWRFDGVAITHDMVVARQMKLDGEIRPERDKRLKALDVAWSRAMAQGNTVLAGQIEAKRQTLRDIPQTVDLSGLSDPSVLKAFSPAWPT